MAVSTLNIEQTKALLLHVADAVVESKPLLTEIDSKIGDGDHGIGMAGGLTKAREALLAKEQFDSVNELFGAAGMAMIRSMGGASGVIFGTLFLGAAKSDASKVLDGALLADMMARALADIQKAGKAQVGDKTMVDALSPAVDALRASPKDDLAALLDAAQQAAQEGVERTREYQAKFGRAKSLMERAIGHQDAGATSVWIIFRAMHEYVATLA